MILKLITEVGEYKNDSKSIKSYVDKYLKFFTGFIDILIKEQRAFFVGIILSNSFNNNKFY